MSATSTRRGTPRLLALLAALVAGLVVTLPGCGSSGSADVPTLAAPESIGITAGVCCVTITWEPVPGATSYNLYWCVTGGVTKSTGTLIPNVTSPYVHSDLIEGETYCYVVTALYGDQESAESPEVGAVPHPAAPGVPQGVTATIPEETSNQVVIEWLPVTDADSYNIYWNTTGDVTTADTVFEGAVSPFLHGGLEGGTTYYYAVTALKGPTESDLSAQVQATPHGPPNPHVEGLGNNLSYPLVFADGYGVTGLPLTGTADAPWLEYNTGLRPGAAEAVTSTAFPVWDDSSIYYVGDTPYWEQKTVSTWQATWFDGAGQDLGVIVDWGDNLGSQRLTTNSVVRIETTLYQTLTASDADEIASTEFTDETTAYQMALLYGQGIDEQQGTDRVTYLAPTRHVYSVLGRMRIEKLLAQGGEVDTSIPAIEKSVWESFGDDGPGGYGAEVNVGGKVVYGYVWMLKDEPLTNEQKVGWWRISFSLDESGTIGEATVVNHTTLVALDPSDEGKATLDSGVTAYEFEVVAR